MKSVIITLLCAASLFAAGAEVDQYIKRVETAAKIADPGFKGFDSKRGEAIFTAKHIGKKGKEIACTSCHTNDLKAQGEHFFTGKAVEPLSPAVNPKRFTSVKDVKKWLRRNFKDVYNREGTAQEKGDVLTYMMNN